MIPLQPFAIDKDGKEAKASSCSKQRAREAQENDA